MKQKFIYLIAVFIVLSVFLQSCIKDEEQKKYWTSFATLIKEKKSDDYFFKLDFGGKIEPTEKITLKNKDEDSIRVVITYTIVTETGKGDDVVISAKVVEINRILTKEIIQLTAKNTDSIGNDEIIVSKKSMWLTDRHLNIVFGYYGANTKHIINLAKPTGKQIDEKGNQILELRHNTNGDFKENRFNGIVAFSLTSLKKDNADSIKFVVKVINGDTVSYKYYNTYYFKNNSTGKVPNCNYNLFLLPDNVQ